MPLAHALRTSTECPSGSVVVAEEQVAGRGRRQRRWETPYGVALLTSILLCGRHLPARASHLPMLAGVAAVRAIAQVEPELAPRLALKWPNDVLIGSNVAGSEPPRTKPGAEIDTKAHGKVAGILVDTSFQQGAPNYAVLGIGINVNQRDDQLPPAAPNAPPPTSLRLQVGRTVDRTQLLTALCEQLSQLVSPPTAERAAVSEHEMRIYNEWRNLLHTLGQPVTVYPSVPASDAATGVAGRSAAQPFTGLATDVTLDGALVVENDAGNRQIFSAGDISIRYGRTV
jgi:BirA family biotin operon repressor/biotin-[acetyl-CoA-carboxylase] ligase